MGISRPCAGGIVVMHILAFSFLANRGADFDAVRRVAGWSFFAAFMGLVGPIGFAFLVMVLVYGEGWKPSLAVGAAIAPTSFGFSAMLVRGYCTVVAHTVIIWHGVVFLTTLLQWWCAQ